MEFYRVIKTVNSAVIEIKEFDEYIYAKNYFENEKSNLVEKYSNATDVEFKQTGVGKNDVVLSFRTDDNDILTIQIQAFDRIVHTASLYDEAAGAIMNVTVSTGNVNLAFINIFMEVLYTGATSCGVSGDDLDDKYFDYSFYKQELGDDYFKDCRDSYTDQEAAKAVANLFDYEKKFMDIVNEFNTDHDVDIIMNSLKSYDFNTSYVEVELFGHISVGNCLGTTNETK